MVVSIKDSIKLIGISIVCFCAVFVCTFFLNYYLDVSPLKDSVSEEIMPLYTAQLATAKMTCGITGGFLGLIAVIMLLFYIKIYIDSHSKILGTLKALSYSNISISKSFSIFGLSVFFGCVSGFSIAWAFMQNIYESLTIEGLPTVKTKFHYELLILLVILPTIVFTIISFAFALFKLRQPTIELLKGKTVKVKKAKTKIQKKERNFLTEMCFSVLKSKKSLAFFVTFSCFCFSAMVQMGLSMESLMEGTMGLLILIIGVVLSIVSMVMSMTTLIRNNSKNISMMKALGYMRKERFIGVFAGYIPFAFIGFIIGTGYQFGLLTFMINVIFKNVALVPDYHFNVKVFFITLLCFVVLYSLAFLFFLCKADKTSLKEIMTEN